MCVQSIGETMVNVVFSSYTPTKESLWTLTHPPSTQLQMFPIRKSSRGKSWISSLDASTIRVIAFEHVSSDSFAIRLFSFPNFICWRKLHGHSTPADLSSESGSFQSRQTFPGKSVTVKYRSWFPTRMNMSWECRKMMDATISAFIPNHDTFIFHIWVLPEKSWQGNDEVCERGAKPIDTKIVKTTDRKFV